MNISLQRFLAGILLASIGIAGRLIINHVYADRLSMIARGVSNAVEARKVARQIVAYHDKHSSAGLPEMRYEWFIKESKISFSGERWWDFRYRSDPLYGRALTLYIPVPENGSMMGEGVWGDEPPKSASLACIKNSDGNWKCNKSD